MHKRKQGYLKNKSVFSNINTLWQSIQGIDSVFRVKLEFLYHTINIGHPENHQIDWAGYNTQKVDKRIEMHSTR